MDNKKLQKQDIFNKLPQDKQEKILHACIQEFGEAGYNQASTNRVAERAGIAKGSLFKYFGTKEDMFYHVADHVLLHFVDLLMKDLNDMPSDILERFAAIHKKTYSFFGENPKMFRLLMRIITDRSNRVFERLNTHWAPHSQELTAKVMEGADLSKLGITLKEFIQIIKWIDFAIDSEAMEMFGPDTTVAELEAVYTEKMKLVDKVLRRGIYRKGA